MSAVPKPLSAHSSSALRSRFCILTFFIFFRDSLASYNNNIRHRRQVFHSRI
jgi:hypothetical protein